MDRAASVKPSTMFSAFLLSMNACASWFVALMLPCTFLRVLAVAFFSAAALRAASCCIRCWLALRVSARLLSASAFAFTAAS